jgi:hypothetical protein
VKNQRFFTRNFVPAAQSLQAMMKGTVDSMDNKNNKALVMKNEIRAIAGYKALLISKFFICLCLALSAYYVGYIGYASSPVYILLVYFVLPSILSYAFKDYSGKLDHKFLKEITNNPPFLLNSLKRKYHYTRVNYVTNNISFFFILFLICLWLSSMYKIDNISVFTLSIPKFMLIVGILLRILGNIFYLLKLPYDLTHNKV